MFTGFEGICLYVSDQDEALEFYVNKLGFENLIDIQISPEFRRVMISPPGAPGVEIVLYRPGPQDGEEEAECLRNLIGKHPRWAFLTTNCQETYEQLRARQTPRTRLCATVDRTSRWGPPDRRKETPMADSSQFYTLTYSHFAHPLLAAIREETFGEDIGQNGWLTAEEYRHYLSDLEVTAASQVLDIGSGSGGPALFLARTVGCQVTGLDINPSSTSAANAWAHALGLDVLVHFQHADASQPLPFAEHSFTTVIGIDSMNHVSGRGLVLKEWARVLRPGGRLLFTDPTIVTGILSNEEIATRSAIGFMLFTPRGENERLIQEAGLTLVQTRDVTDQSAVVSKRWYEARARRKAQLLQLEGVAEFEKIQRWLSVVHTQATERRLSRFAFVAQK